MKIFFRGGLEEHVLSESLVVDLSLLEGNKAVNLIQYLEKTQLKEKYRYFARHGELEGGILCVINDIDWDILEQKETVLKNTDTIYFITTMHGG
ncbi:ubiquitin related modifier 1 [Nematocida displodere]|uniref:Ubiquitin-related modifier 1 n=1 Tax=Nematocida displodere TaxID=1805483 RepID=A0A177EDH6_9MICR|nr:ubiquitin related modifier 1 [Nematocida displodere]